MKSLSTFWKWNLLGWVALLGPQFLNSFAVHSNAGRALGFVMFLFPVEILLSGVLHLIYCRMVKKSGGFSVPTAAGLIILSLVAALMQTMLIHQFVNLTGWHNPRWTDTEEWLLRLIFFWFLYMAWGLVYFWVKAEWAVRSESQRADEAREEASRLELYFLRAQLDPHFLFNALNGVAAQIPSQPNSALAMVRELAVYLRYSLDHRHDAVTSLSDELDALAGYLKIERERFGERLQTRVEASAEARSRLVPSFLLQPLVENAVKHSLQHSLPPWSLSIDASLTIEGLLRIAIRNTGTLAPNSDRVEGVGLQILRRRLELHYPNRHRFLLAGVDGEVRAEIEMEGDPCFA